MRDMKLRDMKMRYTKLQRWKMREIENSRNTEYVKPKIQKRSDVDILCGV